MTRRFPVRVVGADTKAAPPQIAAPLRGKGAQIPGHVQDPAQIVASFKANLKWWVQREVDLALRT